MPKLLLFCQQFRFAAQRDFVKMVKFSISLEIKASDLFARRGI